jgi:subtilisin
VPDVVGPGVGVISAKAAGGYISMDGTSMATPHIAGLAACLWSAKLNATADQIQHAIFQSCALTPEGRARGGRGLPNAIRALSILTGQQLAQVPKVSRLSRRKATAVKAHAMKVKRPGRARAKSVPKKSHRKTRS